MSLESNSCPALVLNADYQPLSYFPLSTWSWKNALKAVFLERVNVVSVYNQKVNSPSTSIMLPSVISLKDYVPLPAKAAFTRFNVFLRDKFTCQYCSKISKAEELTFDHVIPRSKGAFGNTNKVFGKSSIHTEEREIRSSPLAPYPCKNITIFLTSPLLGLIIGPFNFTIII